MSWLARSFANSLRLDDGDDGDSAVIDHHNRTSTSKPSSPSSPSPSSTATHHHEQQQQHQHQQEDHEDEDPSRGVKEDLSEFKQTLAKQFLGVASFLAPPPSSSDQYDDDAFDSADGVANQSDSSGLKGKSVTGISKIASNLYPFRSSSENVDDQEDEEEDEEEEEEFEYRNAVGVTEEVLTFAMNIAMHPETWLHFPIEEEDDLEDFDMSETQREHALAVEHLTPRLAALRIELCPCHMSDWYFWKVYFVLLHSRLNKHDAELLLTPQIKAARALWMQELQKKTKQEQEWSRRETSNIRVRDFYEDYSPSAYYDTSYEEDMPLESLSSESASISGTQDFETEKHPIIVSEMQIVDKSFIEKTSIDEKDLIVGPSPNLLVHKCDEDDEDEDDWLNDEDMKIGGFGTTILIDDEEDVSFSDLEDDDDIVMPIVSKSYNRY